MNLEVPPERYGDYAGLAISDTIMEPETVTACMAAAAASCDDAACMQPRTGEDIHALNTAAPTSVQQMLKRPDKEEWLAASRAEMDNMEEHEVYELVAGPPDMPVLGSRWVFSYKIDESGNISRYKARLVVQGCQQHPDEVIDRWAPTARIAYLRVLLAYAARHGKKVWAFDVSAAYLKGLIMETVYVRLPPL